MALKYKVKTDTTNVSLVDGTQEYDLPSDFYEMIFVEHASADAPLVEWSMDDMRNQKIDWRAASSESKLVQFYLTKDAIGLYPKPNASAVTSGATLTFRYVANPAAYESGGPSDLPDIDHRLVVYWAVLEWCSQNPDSPQALTRLETYRQLFQMRLALTYPQLWSRIGTGLTEPFKPTRQ